MARRTPTRDRGARQTQTDSGGFSFDTFNHESPHGKNSQVLTGNQSTLAPEPNSNPTPMDAGVIGTPPVKVPPPVTNSLDQTLSSIESQALGIQETLNQRAAEESQAVDTTGTDLTQTGVPSISSTGGDLGDQALEQFLNQALGGFQMSEETQDLQTDAAEKNLTLRNLETQMTQYNKETKDELYRMSKNPEGKSMGANSASMTNYKYERYARPGGAADIAIEAQFALNNAQFAYEIANNAVEAEKYAYESQMQAFKDVYTMSRNDMTDSEKLEYQTQLSLYENQANSFMEAKESALQMAALNGASEETIKAIKNARTVAEIYEVGGSLAVADQLQRRKLQMEVDNAALSRKSTLWSMALEGNQEAINELGYDPRMIVANTPLTQEQMDLNNEAHARNKRDQARVETMSINDRGLEALTGAITSPVLGGFFAGGERELGDLSVAGAAAQIPGISNVLGATQSLQAARSLTTDLAYVTKNLTIDKFLQLKAEGATFGAMSEGEWTIIGGAASELDNMIVWEDETKTKIKHINATPTEVKEQLQVIQSQYKSAQLRLDRELLSQKESLEIEENW